MSVLIGDGTDGFGPAQTVVTDLGGFAAGDLDGDGRPDAVYLVGTKLTVFLNRLTER